MVALVPTTTNETQPKLKDQVIQFLTVKGERCQFLVTRNPNVYEPIRTKIRSEINKRFVGWSDDHDRQFDGSAVFFILRNMSGELKAGMRMVISESKTSIVPVSLTSRNCEINFDGALEYSGLWFEEFRYCLAVSGMVAYWNHVNFGDRDVYAIFEASNRVIRRIYLRSFRLNEVQHPLIAYDGFSYKDTDQTVEWQLAVCKRESRLERSNALLAAAGAKL